MSLLINPYVYVDDSTLAEDTFTRANGLGLGNLESGQAWAGDAAAFSIASNRCQLPATPGFSFALFDLGVADFDMTFDIIPSALSGNDVVLVGRWTDVSNHLIFNFSKEVGGWVSRAFEKFGGGSYSGVTTLANPPTGIGNTFDPFRVRLKCDGSTGEVFMTSHADLSTWISQGTWSINGGLTGTMIGVGGNSSGSCQVDNLLVVAP